MGVARRCDIYCRVVDNFGDIGVLWRLARQLGDEFGWRVRLVVDDLTAFRRIEPTIDDTKPKQWCGETEVFAWKCPPIGDFADRELLETVASGRSSWRRVWQTRDTYPVYGEHRRPEIRPHSRLIEVPDIVIEGFGCELPEIVATGMAAQHPQPHWLNLEYLSAESWVAEHHLLPSHHPQLGIAKTFFFPGFEAGTGGLIRERFVQVPPPSTATHQPLNVFLFAYDLRASAAVASVVAESPQVQALTVPAGALADRLAAAHLPKLDVAAFVPQREFDAMLASFDLLFVRGEDSLVRAIWTGKPFVWQIYPQDDRVHWPKLEAFLDLYCRGLAPPAESSLRRLWHRLNDIPSEQIVGSESLGRLWQDYLSHLPEIAVHAHRWTASQMKLPDLASNLSAWVEKSAKSP
ncbi:MAG: elongation factor P maturation arginine rhamnosyltransferase EarP [Betaproteobacteria bacterium]